MQMKKTSISLLAALFFGLFAGNVQAQSQDSVHVDLNKAIEIAMSETPTMRIADRDVQIKQLYKKEQIVSLFPDVSIAANYNRTLLKQTMAMEMGGQSMSIKVGKDNTYSVGANLSLPLVAPALWSSLKLCSQDIELAMEAARSSKLELVNQVKQAYFGYLLAKQSLDVLKRAMPTSRPATNWSPILTIRDWSLNSKNCVPTWLCRTSARPSVPQKRLSAWPI